MQTHVDATTTSTTEVGLIYRTLLFVQSNVGMNGLFLALTLSLPLAALGLGVFMAGG